MKSVRNFLAIFIVALVVSSCATTQPSYEDYDGDARRVGNRVYVDDPYYGNLVLERDPVSGRYYDVTNGYRGYIAPYNSYNYNRYRSYRNYPSNHVYRNNGNTNNQAPSRPNVQQNREEARRKVLGN